MSGSGWTPGPWFMTPSPTHPEQHNVGLSDGITSGIRRDRSDPEEYMLVSGVCTEATARLIAAAPDLAEALDALLYEDSDKSEADRLVTRLKARLALARARGDQP